MLPQKHSRIPSGGTSARLAQWKKLQGQTRAVTGDMIGQAELDPTATEAMWKGKMQRGYPMDAAGRRHLAKALTGAFRLGDHVLA